MFSRFSAILTLIISLLFVVGCASSGSGKGEKQLSPAEKKAKLYYNQGTRDLVSKDYTKALTNLLEAVALDPDNSEIHNNLGMAYYFKKSMSRAVAHIKKSIELNPKNTDAKLNLATIYLEQNQLELAENLYREVLDDLTYEGQQRTHYNLGLIAMKRGRKDLASQSFNEALAIDPDYCPANFKLAEILFKERRYEKAFKQYREAGMGTCISHPQPLYGQVESLIKLGRYPAALAKLKDMQERFAMTKYETYARKTMKRVKALQAKEDQRNQTLSKNLKGEIKAVGF